MRFPNVSLSGYAWTTAIVVATSAALQYTGILYEQSGTVDVAFLVVLAVSFPAFSYLIALVSANVGGLRSLLPFGGDEGNEG